MTRETIDFLLRHDVFCAIMTAMRGPDDKNFELKSDLTAPLRWAVGFESGHKGAPTAATLDFEERITRTEGHLPYGNDHFLSHCVKAVVGLHLCGYWFSRIPLEAYLSPQKAKEQALQILWGLVRAPACGELFDKCFFAISEAPVDDPDFNLFLGGKDGAKA